MHPSFGLVNYVLTGRKFTRLVKYSEQLFSEITDTVNYALKVDVTCFFVSVLSNINNTS